MLSELNRFIAPSLQILESFSIVLLILVTFSSLADLSSEEKKRGEQWTWFSSSIQAVINNYMSLFLYLLSLLSPPSPTVLGRVVNAASILTATPSPPAFMGSMGAKLSSEAKSNAGKQTDTPRVASRNSAKRRLAEIHQLAYNWGHYLASHNHGGCSVPWNLPFKRKRAKESPFIITGSPLSDITRWTASKTLHQWCFGTPTGRVTHSTSRGSRTLSSVVSLIIHLWGVRLL